MSTSTRNGAKGERGVFVREMFARIAPRYDLANRVLTAGLDERWRQRTIRLLAPPRGAQILDCCCGTGDFVLGLLGSDPTLDVTGIDFCPPMLERARRRARRRARGNARFVEGDVMAIPFDDSSFDGATMGFSLRNVVDVDATLREILRILRPGARFVSLDVTKAPNRTFRRTLQPLLLRTRTAARRNRRRLAGGLRVSAQFADPPPHQRRSCASASRAPVSVTPATFR